MIKNEESKKKSLAPITTEVVGEATTLSLEVDGITKRALVEPTARPGLWVVKQPDEENPYEVAISSGYASEPEALKVAEKLLRTGKPTAPKSEPFPIWLDDNGPWQLLNGTGLWPVIPSGLLLELSWVGEGPNPGGVGILIRTWEMTGKTKAVRKAYEDGAQPRVSIVERRLIPATVFMQLKAQVSMALL
jgi:hypothetical protein